MLTGMCSNIANLLLRYGDTFDGKTTTLCVRRATYWDPELGREDPAKKGICSNFLCDAEPGTEITMTGACTPCSISSLDAVSTRPNI